MNRKVQLQIIYYEKVLFSKRPTKTHVNQILLYVAKLVIVVRITVQKAEGKIHRYSICTSLSIFNKKSQKFLNQRFMKLT